MFAINNFKVKAKNKITPCHSSCFEKNIFSLKLHSRLVPEYSLSYIFFYKFVNEYNDGRNVNVGEVDDINYYKQIIYKILN